MEKTTRELVFLDTETTGIELEDRLVQVAYKTGDITENELFKADIPVKIESMAVCHITNKMLEDKEKFQGSESQKKLIDLFSKDSTVLVAHNAGFDIDMLKREGVEVKNQICTLKVARYLDSDAVIPKHNLQYLRYYLDLNIEGTAHDALGDVLVLEGLFKRLFDKMCKMKDSDNSSITENDVIDSMIEISSKPSLIRRFSFGKHEGSLVEDVAKTDKGYIEWFYNQKIKDEIKDEDWIYTLSQYL